jgi:hypothetical protein
MLRIMARLLVVLATLAMVVSLPSVVHAEVLLRLKGYWQFADDPTNLGLVEFIGFGTSTHLGKWTSYGEVLFDESELPGSVVGEGVVVFQAATGEVLAAELVIEIDAAGDTVMALSWQDTVVLSDGTTVYSTGRFIDPPFPGAGAGGRLETASAMRVWVTDPMRR